MPKFSPITTGRQILLIAAMFAVESLSAQYYSLGVDPASVRWNQIKTEHFRVIYPVEFSNKAFYLSNALEYAYGPVSATLDSRLRRYPVIVHNRTTYPNAVVPYAPKRIEFLTLPPQDTYAMDWLDQLVLHELRHTAQYSAINTGFTRALGFLMGQQAVPAIMGLFVPLWFVEGDATVTETALSLTGRGRDPSFIQDLRAQLLDKGLYSYDKAVHGSFKDHTPDRYELGYHLVGKARESFGVGTWSFVLHKTGSMPLTLAPFSLSLRKETGMGKRKLYRQLMESLKEEWRAPDNTERYTSYRVISRQGRSYSEDLFPEPLGDSLLLAYRVPLNGIRMMTLMNNDGRVVERWPAAAGQLRDNASVHGNMVCWTERKSDPRWSLRDYTVIRTRDLATGKTHQLTRKTRYTAPRFSHDGQRIAVSEVGESGENALVILDAASGDALQRISTPENHFFISPSWSLDDRAIYAVVQADQGMSLARISLPREEISLIMPASVTRIADPYPFGQYILFTGAYSGTDNIFALEEASGNLFQVTSSRFGASNPVVTDHGDSLVYTEYTSMGAVVAKTSLVLGSWAPWTGSQEDPFPLAERLSEQESFSFNRDSIPLKTYFSKPYRRGLNLFNFHSWAPVSINVDNMDFKPGVTLFSQSLLGTAYTGLGWEYDLNEEVGKYTFSFDYLGLYPAFSLDAGYGLRRGTHIEQVRDTIPYKYNELDLEGSVYLPLNWNRGSWYRGLRPEAGASLKYLFMEDGSEVQFTRDRVQAMNYSLYLYNQHVSALQDIYPRWGQVLQLNFSHTPFRDGGTNTIHAAQALFYLPGLFRNHGIRLYAAYQERDEDYYHYSHLINLPRGWSGLNDTKLVSLSAAYAMPLFYPDWQIGPVMYVKRFRTIAFYDHAFNPDLTGREPYNTIGLDLTANFHFLSFLSPIEAGVRSMYFPSDQSFGFRLLFSIEFDSLY